MDDRELLEAAAKAAGMLGDYTSGWFEIGRPGYWNPLRNDADAFRLAVKLEIGVFPPESEQGNTATAMLAGDDEDWFQEPVTGNDPCAATRRAIVRAAAALAQESEHHG